MLQELKAKNPAQTLKARHAPSFCTQLLWCPGTTTVVSSLSEDASGALASDDGRIVAMYFKEC